MVLQVMAAGLADPRWLLTARAVAMMVFGTALAGCGGGGGDAVGDVGIAVPTASGHFETDQAMLSLGGSSFRPTTTTLDLFACRVLTDQYTVTWLNEASGRQGGGVDPYRWWRACPPDPGPAVQWRFIDLPLAPGGNRVVVTARDEGIGGQAIIVIERVPDLSPPRPTALFPADGETGVPGTTSLAVTFSEPMDPASFSTASFTLVEAASGVPIAGAVVYVPDLRQVEFRPDQVLQGATAHRAELLGARDLAGGNAIQAPIRWTFGTAPD